MITVIYAEMTIAGVLNNRTNNRQKKRNNYE